MADGLESRFKLLLMGGELTGLMEFANPKKYDGRFAQKI